MYVALDIETTGLDTQTCQVLEIAMVVDVQGLSVRDCPVFHAIIRPEGLIVGEPYALAMNSRVLGLIADGKGHEWDGVVDDIQSWLTALVGHGMTATLLGKNVGSFDIQVMRRYPHWPSKFFSYHSLDVGSLYATPEGIKSQKQLMREFGQDFDFPGNEHEAVYDARCSLALARLKMGC